MSIYNADVPAEQLFPQAYGTEEETGMMVRYNGGDWEEPHHLLSELKTLIPDELKSTNTNEEAFLVNGMKVYIGGAAGDIYTNLERATAECADPAQLSLALRASERLLVHMAQTHAVNTSEKNGGSVDVRIQRRTVDSQGSRKACHDNYGIDRKANFLNQVGLPKILLAHLASRSFVTGAGLVTTDGLRFAQKIDGLSKVVGSDYSGMMLRFTRDEGSERLEIRCSDINLSDWAVQMRVGSVALAIALSQLELQQKTFGVGEQTVINSAKLMNGVELNREGSLKPTQALRQAVDMQQTMAETFLTLLTRYPEELPPELDQIAVQLYEYCDDFRKVMAGSETIYKLADRADWAAKFEKIRRRVVAQQDSGVDRSMTDIYSQYVDMKYDHIGIRAADGTLEEDRVGWGYKLRDAGHFRGSPKDLQLVDKLYYAPPKQTRAALRGHILKRYVVGRCNWHYVFVPVGDKHHGFVLNDPLQTELSASDEEILQGATRR